MSATVRRVDYFYLMIEDRPGSACRILETLAQAEVNLLAFSVIPTGTSHTQLVVFPEHSDKLARAAEKEGFVLTGPQRALMTSGDDRLGALVDLHMKLADARVKRVRGPRRDGRTRRVRLHLPRPSRRVRKRRPRTRSLGPHDS